MRVSALNWPLAKSNLSYLQAYFCLSINPFAACAPNQYHHEKKELTILEQAEAQVPQFSKFIFRVKKKMVVNSLSKSTIASYTRHLAKLALHFHKLPTQLGIQEIDDYLYLQRIQTQRPTETSFKFTVYSLRFAFRMEGLEDKRIKLPKIKLERSLPVVLSRREMKLLLNAPKLLKHRILIGLLYGCGLRCMEARGIQLRDLDFDRKMLHVRKGKGKKDRYVPLCSMLIKGLKSYIRKEKPQTWLFNGKPEGRKGGDFDSRYSQKGVQFAVSSACKRAGITKKVNVHTLRHTYATHLIEDGLNIISVKNLLGHANISTTMIYLHVAESAYVKPFSPMERLNVTVW